MSGYSAVFKQANKKESPSNKRQHIRFDNQEEEEDDDDHQQKNDGDGVITSSSKAATANNDLPSSNNSQKRKKKRKRSATTTPSDTPSSIAATNKHQEDKIFNGLMLALSTDNKQHQSDSNNSNKEEDDPYNNLKSLKTILQSHGATISPQVHKRVHYLICTPCAITNLTQRIRQAMKRNVDIVSVDWVKKCVDEKRRVDVVTSESDEKYLWNDWAREIMVEKECEKKRTSANNNNSANSNNDDEDGGYDSDNIPQEDDNRGWSTPVQLDCCCVCHENGDLNCPWCGECNINLAMKKTTKKEENI